MISIPKNLQGDQSIIVAEEPGGSPIIMPKTANLVMRTEQGDVHCSQFRVLATIEGISQEAVERIVQLVGDWHAKTGVPIMPITKENILRALVHEEN